MNQIHIVLEELLSSNYYNEELQHIWKLIQTICNILRKNSLKFVVSFQRPLWFYCFSPVIFPLYSTNTSLTSVLLYYKPTALYFHLLLMKLFHFHCPPMQDHSIAGELSLNTTNLQLLFVILIPHNSSSISFTSSRFNSFIIVIFHHDNVVSFTST